MRPGRDSGALKGPSLHSRANNVGAPLAAPTGSSDLVRLALDAPLFHAEWVLYLLIATSIVSLGVMLERLAFYAKRRLDLDSLRKPFSAALSQGNYDEAAKVLGAHDTLETNVVLFALKEHKAGPDAVEDLLIGATQKEREHRDKERDPQQQLVANAPTSVHQRTPFP